MLGLRPRMLALTAAAIAVGTLAMLPDELDAANNCLPRELKSKLAQVSQKFGKVQIVSTYRSGARMPNGRTSFHASCRAVDFNPPRGKYSQVASWLKSHRKTVCSLQRTKRRCRSSVPRLLTAVSQSALPERDSRRRIISCSTLSRTCST